MTLARAVDEGGVALAFATDAGVAAFFEVVDVGVEVVGIERSEMTGIVVDKALLWVGGEGFEVDRARPPLHSLSITLAIALKEAYLCSFLIFSCLSAVISACSFFTSAVSAAISSPAFPAGVAVGTRRWYSCKPWSKVSASCWNMD